MSISDVTNSNGYIGNTEKHISEDGVKNSAAWIVPAGAISLAMYASVGKLAILDTDTATSQAFFNMVFDDEILRDFVYQSLVKANEFDEWNRIVSTGTQDNLNADKVKNFEIKMPISKKEMIDISAFFKKVNNLITLHQREYDKTINLKKAMLEKMFPKNGEDRPEIRFKGFTDAWEQRKLSDLYVKCGSGGTPRSTNSSYYGGEIPFLSISDVTNSNGYIGNTEKHISEDGVKNSAAWIVPAGAISLAMYASVGKLAILDTDTATSQAFFNMVFDDEILRDFVYQSLVKANEFDEWNRIVSTGTQDNLNADKVKNFEIKMPISKKEMIDISAFFKKVNNLITLHQRELKKLQNMKKAMLEKMFAQG